MKSPSELNQFDLNPDVRAWVIAALEERDQQLGLKDQQLHQKDQKIQLLVQELAHLKRMKFGTRSEAYSQVQPDLFEEVVAEDQAELTDALEQESQPAVGAQAPRQGAGRQTLPEHLERIIHRHEPASCTCGQCGQDLVLIREDVTEQLDVVPAKFFVHRHVRPQYACRHCETVQAEPVHAAIIDGGMASPGLLTWVVINKFLDHLPLYRQVQIAARQKVHLPISTLAEWVGRTGVALQPLSLRLGELLRERQILHADETPVNQLAPGQGKTHRSYLWAYRSCDLDEGPPIIVFDYQTGRSGEHARNFLGTWRGHLMVDDFAGYKKLFAEGRGVIDLGCWAHARRKFFDLNEANKSPIAAQALERIGALYAIERRGRALGAAARTALRQEEAYPLLTDLHQWLVTTRKTVADSSGTARAMDYTLKRWPALTRYAESGIYPIDNNAAENCIRPVVIGKKNWLYMGSERAGRRAAHLQSLLGTAKLNGLDPHAWLKDTLEKLPTWPHSRLDELLPLRGHGTAPSIS